MKISKSLVKGSLLLSSVLLLSACADDGKKEETTVAEDTTAAVVKDTTMEETETSVEETRAASESSEESMEESEESMDESEESKDESEESKDESEESKDESEESKDESEESKDESEESKDESEESKDESEESKDESEESKDESEESKDESEESMDESEESKDAAAVVADGELQDGEYKAVSNEDEHGWKVNHTIVVKDGKITESKFDYVNAEGKLKSEDEEYNKNMKEKTGVSGAEAMEQLNAALVEGQSADVDVVSGATSTSETFQFSSKVLLKAAAEGNTEEINLDELPLQDGEFTAKGEEDEHGWSPMMTMVVKDGKITEVTFDYENAEGKLKSEDEEYNKNMKDKAGVSAAEAMEQLSAALVEKQQLDQVDVVSGATSTSEDFMGLAKQLIKASQMQESSATTDESSSESASEDSSKSDESTTEEVSSEESSEESSN